MVLTYLLNGPDDLITTVSQRRGVAAVGLAILAGIAILRPPSIDIPAPRSLAVQVCGWIVPTRCF